MKSKHKVKVVKHLKVRVEGIPHVEKRKGILFATTNSPSLQIRLARPKESGHGSYLRVCIKPPQGRMVVRWLKAGNKRRVILPTIKGDYAITATFYGKKIKAGKGEGRKDLRMLTSEETIHKLIKVKTNKKKEKKT